MSAGHDLKGKKMNYLVQILLFVLCFIHSWWYVNGKDMDYFNSDNLWPLWYSKWKCP